MPGICGFAGQLNTTNVADELSSMIQCMMHHDWYVHHEYVEPVGRMAIGCVALDGRNESSPAFDSEFGQLVACLVGEIYDEEDHRNRLLTAGARFESASLAELIGQGFSLEGIGFFRSLHGKFAAAIWDGKKNRLYLVNDRFGMKPMYFTHIEGRLVFGSEIKSLFVDSAVSRKPNMRGVAQFFTFGQLLGDDTLFESIELLPAASLLTYDVDAGCIHVEPYWRLQSNVVAGRSQTESLDQIASTFLASVERMTAKSNGLGLSLSGGLDARTLLGVYGPGRQLTSLSLGMSGSMDHRSAAEMARQLGYPHRQVVLDEQFLNDFESHLRRMVRLTDGQYLCQCIVMPTLPIYRELGVSTLLRGHVGELMHMTKAYNFTVDSTALAIRTGDELFLWLWRRLQAFMMDGTEGRLFAPRYRAAIEGLARDSLRQCVDRTAGTEPTPHRIWQLFYEQRTRRETALSLVEFDSVVQTRLPYLDNELIEALFEAPPEMKLGETIQAHILRRHRPELLNVVNVNTGTRVGAGRWRRRVANFQKRVFAKLGLPGYQPYERLGLWLRRELRPLVNRLLLSEQFLGREIFSPDAVRAAVAAHMSGRRNHTYLLLALLIFEIGQQELVDQDMRISELAIAS